MEKKILTYFIALLVIHFSCNSRTNLKRYGVITSEIGETASIDTTTYPHHPVPVTLTVKLFELKNKSNDQKIVFVCKCTYRNYDGSVSGDTEEHVVGPQEIVELNRDSGVNYHVIKYEVIEAHLATNRK